MIATRMLRGTADICWGPGRSARRSLFGLVAAPFAWIAPTAIDVAYGDSWRGRDDGLACVNARSSCACKRRRAYQYTDDRWAVALGLVVFGDVPDIRWRRRRDHRDGRLYIFWREQIVAPRDRG